MAVTSVNIVLPEELQDMVRAKLSSGRYRSADEVVQEALRLLDERDRQMDGALEDLRAKVAVGLDAARRGQLSDGDEFFAELEREEQANQL